MPLDDQSELFYLVDEEDNILGSITRAEAHDGSRKLHRAVEIIVSNERGQILFQKRSMKKDTCPGEWALSVGGHVTFGDSYEEAVVKEMQEEIGLTVPCTFHSQVILNANHEREIVRIYTATVSNETVINFDTDEIDEIAWINKADIHTLITNGPVTTLSQQSLQQVYPELFTI